MNTAEVITALVAAGASRLDAASAVFGVQADGAGTVSHGNVAFTYTGTGYLWTKEA